MIEENARLYEEAQRRLRELTTLYEASQACLSISDQEGLLAAIIEAAAQATDATLGSVMLIDEKKGEYVFGAHYGLSKETIVAVEAELHIPLGEGLVGAVITREQPMVVPDVTKDPRWIPMEETKESIRSFLGVPLIGREGRPLGALTLSRSDVGAFDEDHTRLLSTFANQAAMAIENARLYEQVQARSRYLETLQRINATLRSTLPLSEVLATIVRGAGEALNYAGSLIVIPDASGERLTLGAAWGGRFLDAAVRLTGLELDAFSLPLTAEENPMARAYLSGELQAWSRAPERIVVGIEPPISSKLAPVIEQTMGARLAVCVPLPAGEKAVGVLAVFSPREQLPDEERAILLGLADQAGLAIENAQLYEQTQQEITERKQAEEALAYERDLLHALMDNIPDTIYFKDTASRFTRINRAQAQVLGVNEPKEAIGKTDFDFFPVEHARDAYADEQEIMKSGQPLIDKVEELRKANGPFRWVSATKVPIIDKEGRVTGIVGISRDSTERKQAEEALRESQTLFHSLIESLPQNIFSKDLEGRFTFANQRYCMTEGKSLADILGKTDFDLHPPDLAQKYREDDRRVIETGQLFETVEEHQPIGGERFYVQVVKTPVYDSQGQVTGILGIFWDITERKQAEEALQESEKRYRRLFEDSPISLWEEDFSAVKTYLDRLRGEGVRDFRTYLEHHPEAVVQCAKMVKVIDVNKATLELYQAESKDILQGDLAKALTTESYDAFREELVAIAEGKTSFESDTISETVAGEKKYTILRWSVAPGHEEILSKVLVSITDITARKRAEEALAQQARELARSNAFTTALSQMAARIEITPDPDQVMETLGTELEKLGITCMVGMLEPDGQAMVIRYTSMGQALLAAGEKLTRLKMRGYRIVHEHFPIWAELVEQKRAVFVADAVSLMAAALPSIMQSVVKRVFRLGGWVSDVQVIWLPLMVKNRVIGGLAMWGPDLRESDLPTLSVFAAQVATALENARLYAAERQRTEELMQASEQLKRELSERKRAEEVLRESEERYRALYEDNPSMYFTVDPEGTVLSVNQFGVEQLGYTVEELVGQSVLNIFYKGDKESVLQQLTACLQNPTQIAHWEFRKVRKDGSVLWVKEAARAVRGADGHTVVLIVCEDITERKRLEEQLRQAQKMDAIGNLAGGIAHDFNNLLTPIGGFAELLLWKTPEGSQQHEYLRQIKIAAERAAALTRQLLTFARRDQVEVHALNLNEVAREVVGLLERTIDKAIAIEPYLADDLEVVEGDANQLHQVLLNLCLNARDAMPDGGRLIIETRNITLSEAKVRTGLDLKAGQYVLASVTDTGIGMTAETQQHLFEPFFTTKTQGRGIGLAMTYGIVRRHGGTIHVYSEPRQGSTFKVYLPVARSQTEDTAPQEVKAVGGSETVLVVDDEEPVRRLLRRILEEGGYTVLLAADGVEAVELYTRLSTEIDLVVLDIIMPRMGGQKTYEQLRKINPEVKVLLSSGYSANGRARDILAAGARGFLQKPYDLQAVLRTVREALES